MLQLCTFQPKLNKRPLSEEWLGSVIERSEAWQQRRDQKVQEAREQDADKDLQGCTFWLVLDFCRLTKTPSNTSCHSFPERAFKCIALPTRLFACASEHGQ